MNFLLIVILLLMCSYTQASDSELHLGRFSAGDMTGWKEQTIGVMKQKTTYGLTKDNDRMVLIAHSSKAASGQIYNLNLDTKEYPTLKWSWKIEHTIKKGDEKTKDGEDFAARVYVVFPRGFFSKTRSICYVWANKLPKGEHVPSPFSSNIITVAADSGEELAGHWTFHQRNIYEDYRLLFGEEPPKIGAVAVMTDTDNTGETATACYGDISLVRSTKTNDVKKTRDVKQKEQPDKVGKGTGDQHTPATELPKPLKPVEEQKPAEPNKKEQPTGTNKSIPASAPGPAVQK